MPLSMSNAQLSLLKEQLITLDLENPDEAQCSAIEDACVDLLRAGQLESIKKIMLEVQQVWGTLPERPLYRGRVRFVPGINPLARFVDSGETDFLKSISKNYFGFCAAGLSLDVPESHFGKRDGYLRSITLGRALDAHKGNFAAFRCQSRGQLGAYVRLLSDEIGGTHSHWEFVENGDVDFTNFRVFAFAEHMNQYAACRGIWKAAGLGVFTSNGLVAPESPTPHELETQLHLIKALGTDDAVPLVIGLQRVIEDQIGVGVLAMTAAYEQIARHLGPLHGMAEEKISKTLAKGALGINFSGSDKGLEFANQVIDWLGAEKISQIYKPEALYGLYQSTQNRHLLHYVSGKYRDTHFSRDLGI